MTKSKDDFNDDDFFENELEGLGEDLQSLDDANIKYPEATTPAYSSDAESAEESSTASDAFLDVFDEAVSDDPAPASQDDEFFDSFENADDGVSVVDRGGADEELQHNAAYAEEDIGHDNNEEASSGLPNVAQSTSEPPLLEQEQEQEQIIEFDVAEESDNDEQGDMDAAGEDSPYGSFADEELGAAARKEFDTKKAAFIAVPVIIIAVVFGVFLKYQQMVGGKARQPQATQAQFVPENSGVSQQQQPKPQSPSLDSNPPAVHSATEPLAQGGQKEGMGQSVGYEGESDLFAPVAPVDEKAATRSVETPNTQKMDGQVAATIAGDDAIPIPEQSGAFSSSFYERLGDPRVQFNGKKIIVEPGGEDVSVKKTVTQEGDIPAERTSAVDTVDRGLGGATEWLKVQFSAVREDMVAINTKLDQAAIERKSLRDGLEGLSRRVSELEGKDAGGQSDQSPIRSPVQPQSTDSATLRIIGAMNGKAWVLLGEEVVTRTIVPGDDVPGFGKVVEISADACAVRFASGKKVCE